jgi:hypothetical protein
MAGEWMLKGWNRTQKNQANWNQKIFFFVFDASPR